ncbi:pyridoxine kinase [Tistlia consotensis]|uniref:pyridoxal kinase n=1 Tax=Tistlia consotensis USBA 355 TaxID=560819 RepID=A0A1Y6BGJ9_9PROT|nr:pyridoxal kinase [Tistlia consotensis]SMF10120.1 pyridoxine kinase [Tistlia consotensis USBA 355]SNR33972.1 pyridoxine kinase [Tistlia consotensis]
MTSLVLSVQSHVAAGCVGNRAAVFTLERLGHGVAAVHTLQFSNHLGHGAATGTVFPHAEVRAVLEGTLDHLGKRRIDALLTGYLGAAENAEAAVAAAQRIRTGNPEAFWLCDPVMGDLGRLYVGEALVETYRGAAAAAADVLTPNAFELEILSGRPVEGPETALAAARSLLGPRTRLVVATSLPGPGPGEISNLAVTAEGAWLLTTPLLPFAPPPSGSGDVFAALLCDQLLRATPMPEALGRVGNALYAVLEATLAAQAPEVDLVGAQGLLLEAPQRFAVTKVD